MSDCYRETPRTARKSHRCCECMATIDPGERYVVCSGVSDGEGWSYKLCAFCCALMRQTRALCEVPEDGPTFCGLREWLGEYGRWDDGGDALIDQLFPLVAEAAAEHTVSYYAKAALGAKLRTGARGVFVGSHLAAQLRLRALRASRWTVDGRVAA